MDSVSNKLFCNSLKIQTLYTLYIPIKFINQGIKNTLIIPATVMERDDKAPSVSPISIAFAVPRTWKQFLEKPLEILYRLF